MSGNNTLARFQPQLGAGIGATLVQPLLKGFRIDDARAQRDISLLGRDVADAELQSAVALTTRQVRHAFWAWLYARDFLDVQQQSLKFAAGSAGRQSPEGVRRALLRVST